MGTGTAGIDSIVSKLCPEQSAVRGKSFAQKSENKSSDILHSTPTPYPP